ncbi:carbamoyl phosphate synthase [Nocardioides aromaticivorans]|uniref:biotin carboxylase n=1 Tax=Nocardioides aromaticivorans TaxID=200618 RepID=A0ABX7PS91_9ACTN|nr:acetyl-CoA carboxylase biotin carboxylase subunit [Nocardioides aromaticivorans]QSR28796.1 carbamoyl phosphate synthase [Nocardioides aromaticivorans]
MFSKVLIANRGEIAVRVIRTCRELGIASVAVHSDPDAASLHVRVADESVLLPGTSPADTYLDIAKVIEAARSTGAEAIHPGYGFLAENAEFAAAVEAAGLVFIGPPAAAIDVMGEKVAAREVAESANVPQVPGSAGAIETVEEVLAFGEQHGYPIAIKASYGGGGRGMRTVQTAADVADALESAQREAKAAFGRGDVYLERYIENARHVEVQLFADSHDNVVWLGDRDCSVQRRHQKVVEEAPAPGLSAELREAMGEASVRLARKVGYRGAGTVEFLVETDPERFYFLEMNTRIQVEHPVTEMTLGLDLIREQLQVAAGEPLSIPSSGPEPRGHAIEVRVNAEDVAGGAFRPSPGPIVALNVPDRAGVRFDGGYEAGDEVLPYYDSLIGKLVVWAPTRDHAIDRALAAIAELQLTGVPTTLPAAAVIMDHPDFRKMAIGTRWLENSIDLASLLPAAPAEGAEAEAGDEDEDYDRQEVWVGGRRYVIPLASAGAVPAAVAESVAASPSGGARPSGNRKAGRGGARKAAGSGLVTSPMQGTVIKVNVAEGQDVAEGDIVAVMEAMKMENPLRATVAGTVTSVEAKPGDVVAAGTTIVQIAPAAS